MTDVYKVWTGTEQVHKEQLSVFSSSTKTGEHHMKALGRVCEQEKGNILPQNTVKLWSSLSRTYCQRSSEMGAVTQKHG